MKHLRLIIMLIVFSPIAEANMRWVRADLVDGRCTLPCGRNGMDDVVSVDITKKVTFSVCSSLVKGTGLIASGQHRAHQKPFCQVNGEAGEGPTSCLCADNGAPGKKDFNWIAAKAAGRCDSTCKDNYPKYGYAVYTGYYQESWAHVCMNKAGEVGYTGGGQLGCATVSGVSEDFSCLCSQNFAGDLDPRFDP